jgi:transcriptional regulator of acetoin/glycerol metabolism
MKGAMAKNLPATGKASPTPRLDALIQADPDRVDRIFEYILVEVPGLAAPARLEQLKADVRAEFAGEEQYIAKRPPTERQRRVDQVLARFNGRNATELARQLRIGRATVYRILKRPGSA